MIALRKYVCAHGLLVCVVYRLLRYASTTNSASIGATSQSNPLCDPLTSFLDRFGVIAADRGTSSRGAHILKLLRQVQAFYCHRQLSFLRVLKKLFLTAKEYMDGQALADRYDDKGPSAPDLRTAALVYQAVRDQFVCPPGGRSRGNRGLHESNLWASWVEARRNLLPRDDPSSGHFKRARQVYEELMARRCEREHWPPIDKVIPRELLQLLAEYDTEVEATGSCGSTSAVDEVDAQEMAQLRASIRHANAEAFMLTEQAVLELLLLWTSMRSSLACGLALLRQEGTPPRSFRSTETDALQRFAWHSHRVDYRLLLENFFPHASASSGDHDQQLIQGAIVAAAATADRPLPLLPRRDGPDSLRCLIVLQASNVAHFAAWSQLAPLGDDLHPFNPLRVLPSDADERDMYFLGRSGDSNAFDCWGVALAVVWRLLGCFQQLAGRPPLHHRRRDRDHVRRLLARWDSSFNLDHQDGQVSRVCLHDW